uniref:Uncharacterized protein n=1 Tax=Oryza glumipatula TaxID=40148 RepID=A0A0E0B6Z7_9ORYZ
MPASLLVAACRSVVLRLPRRRSRQPLLATARRLHSPQPLPTSARPATRYNPSPRSLTAVSSDGSVEVGEGRQGSVKGVVALARWEMRRQWGRLLPFRRRHSLRHPSPSPLTRVHVPTSRAHGFAAAGFSPFVVVVYLLHEPTSRARISPTPPPPLPPPLPLPRVRIVPPSPSPERSSVIPAGERGRRGEEEEEAATDMWGPTMGLASLEA